MVQGGLPIGSSVVLQGPPGQDKLRFALTFLAEGLNAGGSGLVVTASQSPETVIAELRELGVDLGSVTNENRLRIVDWYSWSEETVHDIEEREIVIRSSIDLTNLGVALSRAIAALTGGEPRRAVIELLSPATSSYEVTQVYAFAQSAKRKFDRHQFTSLVLLEKEMHSSPQLTTLHQPFDGVIEIERTRSGDRIVRKIGVLHLKDTAPDPTFRVLEMSESGMRVVQDGSKPTPPTSPSRGSVLESQDERAQRLRLILQIATERLKLNPGDADALFAMAAAQATLDDATGGLETLDRLAAIDSAYPGLWVLKTKLHAKLGQGDLARESRLRAQQTEPEAAKEIDANVPCPMCEAPLAIDATTCANCGVKFAPSRTLEDELDDLGKAAIQEMVQEELAGQAKPEPEPKPPTPSAPKPAAKKPPAKPSSKRGMTNGLVLDRAASRRAGMTNGLKGRTNGLRGRTNGLTNGIGRTNGLTNGVGRTNGLTNSLGRTNGLTNGLGRTNGITNGLGRTNGITNGLGRTNGLTNGLGGARSAGFHSSRARGKMRYAGWKLYLIPIVVVLLLLVPLFLVPEFQGPTYPIQIDGQFGDWNGVSRLSVTSAAANPDIDITQVAVKDNLDYLSFYIRVRGVALNGGPSPGRVTNAFYAFIDVDRSASTGYQVQGIGADRMVRINTWGGQVVSSSVTAFNTSRGPTDWNGWVSIGPVYAAGSTDQIEFETPWLDLAQNPAPVDVAFASRSWDGQSDAADLVATNAEAFLLVSQVTNAPSVASGSGTSLAQITLRAVNGTIMVHAVNVTFGGTFGPSSISDVDLVDAASGVLSTQPMAPVVQFSFSPITLASGDTRTFSVRPHVSSPDGTTVGAFVRDVEDVLVSGGGVAFVGPRTSPTSLAYVGFVPSGPRVDGGFGEWTNVTADPLGDVQSAWNPDIDLSAYGFQGYGNDSYFEASVVGTVLNGTMVPALNPTFTPSTGNGSSNGTISPPPPPVAGTDYVRFFVDADGNASTGYAVGAVGADLLVEITGKIGVILSSDALRFSGANPFEWAWTRLGAAAAAKDASQIEASVAGVRITNASRAFVQISGWNGARDDSSPAPPITVLSVNGTPTGPSPSLTSSSDLVSVQDIGGNAKWFFTNGAATSTAGCTNTYAASTTFGSSPTSTDLTGTSSICWTTPNGQPSSTLSGTWEFYLDISSKTNGKRVLHPNADGAVDQWSTIGSNPCASSSPWQCVKEDTNDGDNTAVVSTSSSVIDDLFQIETWTPTPPSPFSIINLTVEASCKYVSGSGDLRALIQVGSPATKYQGGSLPTCSTSSYSIVSSVWATNPSNNNPWAFSDLSNLQIGVRDNDGTSNEVRVSNVRLFVYFKPIYSVEIDLCTSANCGTNSKLYGPTNANSFGNDMLQTASIAAQSLSASQYLRFVVSSIQVSGADVGGTVTVSYNGPNPGASDSRVTIPVPEFGDIALPLGGTALIAVIVPRVIRRQKRASARRSHRNS